MAIARALINDPVLILADEPTGALDAGPAWRSWRSSRTSTATGITVVLVTHEPDVARYAGRVLSFRDGRLIRDEAVRDRLVARASCSPPCPAETSKAEEDLEPEVAVGA